MIQNISRSGALIAINSGHTQVPHPGDEVTVDMLLARSNAFDQRCMQCRGPVARVERDAAGSERIGVRFDVTTVCTAAETWLWHENNSTHIS